MTLTPSTKLSVICSTLTEEKLGFGGEYSLNRGSPEITSKVPLIQENRSLLSSAQ